MRSKLRRRGDADTTSTLCVLFFSWSCWAERKWCKGSCTWCCRRLLLIRVSSSWAAPVSPCASCLLHPWCDVSCVCVCLCSVLMEKETKNAQNELKWRHTHFYMVQDSVYNMTHTTGWNNVWSVIPQHFILLLSLPYAIEWATTAASPCACTLGWIDRRHDSCHDSLT